jgi:prolyl oligopeptidase
MTKVAGAALAAALSLLGCGSSDSTSPPITKIEMVEETIHGVKVADPYRWLEDQSSASAKAWVAEQTSYARGILDPLPAREKLRGRLGEVLSTGSVTPPEVAAGRYFYAKKEGDQNQPIVYMRQGRDGADKVLIDPNQGGTDDGRSANRGTAEGTTDNGSTDVTVTVDWFVPSKDGKLLAYGGSVGGTETSTLYLLDIDTGETLEESIPKVRIANPQWLTGGSGFYYSRPRDVETIGPGEEVYDRRIYFHKLGAAFKDDQLVFGEGLGGEGLEKEEMPDAHLSPEERYLLIDVFMGWGRNRLYVRDLRRDKLITIAEDGENAYTGEIIGDTLYLLTNWKASRYQIFAVDLRKPERENWRRIVPEGKSVIEAAIVVGGKLFTAGITDAHSELAAYSLDGKNKQVIPLPEIGTASGLTGETAGDEVFFEFTSFTTPAAIYRIDVNADLSRSDALSVWNSLKAAVDPSEFESKQVFYPSKDGTIVPMYIIHKKGIVADGAGPGLLYGYGGFNISLTPVFRGYFFPWLESGGVLAIANMRGGSEYGEDWHRAGMLDKKQNVFDDFLSAAEYLIQKKWVDPGRFAIHGRSNGGLLMGAAMTQRPDLFQVVICGVPLLDMIRYQRFRMARLWISEYGSSENAEDFQWLHAYSPYHRVTDGESYPATIIYTADADSRVDPMHALKMVARLQAATASDAPIVLRYDTEAGHGGGKPLSKVIDEWVDIWSFAFDQLGIEY